MTARPGVSRATCGGCGMKSSEAGVPGAVDIRWRYSVRWCLPYTPCPGPLELMVVQVPPGQRAPQEILDCWATRPQGYGLCVDFPQSKAVKRWTAERKGAVRLKRLEARLQRQAPLFADELLEREQQERADYFKGL